MSLIKETIQRFRCPRCGYSTDRDPGGNECPACQDGKGPIYGLSEMPGSQSIRARQREIERDRRAGRRR